MATTDEIREDVERADGHEHDEASEALPESVRTAASDEFEAAAKKQDRDLEIGVTMVDATEWLMESDEPTQDEVQAVELKINIAPFGQPKRIMSWFVVPLPDAEFRRFRQMAQPRKVRRGMLPSMGDMNDGRYHELVVTAATVNPDLREVARSKGVEDPAAVLRHRFAHKPGLIAQISGMISDASGFSEDDVDVVEKAAGNS